MTPREEYDAQVLLTNKALEQLNVALKELLYAIDHIVMERAADDGAIVPDTTPIQDVVCDHICTSNCRRDGCNCKHGEYHE